MTHEPIAIVGIGCRFPGGADDPESFWRLLVDGVDAIGLIPPDRFDVDALYDPDGGPGRIASRHGGFLHDVDRFDAAFFGISPREAERLDPQQRLLLEVAWEALEDGGHVPSELSGTRTAVFAGIWLSDYEARLFGDPEGVDFHMTTGTGRYSASGRLSYAFGLLGPSVTIDTACSSSLVAVHLACRSIQAGECEVALAGGANVILQPQISIAYSRAGMLAADGRCKFGDAAADGYVRSEGAGIVVLKRLDRALADGDRIHALVLGSAVNNDGRTSGELATPGVGGQRALLDSAWDDAGVRPDQVVFVEAHGTGTRAGDPVELTALGAALGPGRSHPCLVGSVKTNLGHTEGAAGVAGLIKAALALRHGVLPPSLHVTDPNPAVAWDELGLSLVRAATQLAVGGFGGVSSFGIAGTNAHVVLGPPPPPPPGADAPPPGALLLPISAASPEALTDLVGAYASLLSDPAAAVADVCYTAATRRAALDHRLAVAGETREDLVDALAAAAAQATGLDPADPGDVAFVFPGQGSQWPAMGRELIDREPAFGAALERCEEAMRPFVDWSLLGQLAAEPGSPEDRLLEIDVLQPTLASIEIALAALWRSWGVEPAAVVGHSMGEVAAAYVAGALSLDDAMKVICTRSRLLRQASGTGAMASVELSVEAAERAIAPYEGRLSVAVSNSPRATVVAGDPDALADLLAVLEAQQVFCRTIKVDVASHSAHVDPLLPELRRALSDVAPSAGSVPIYSAVLAEVVDGATFDAEYWALNLRRPVRFADMVRRLAADGCNVFIELSPHPILLPAIEQCLQEVGSAGLVLPSLRRDEPEQATMLGSLGRLWAVGGAVDLRRLRRPGGRCVTLPRYPWQRERFWIDGDGGRAQQGAGRATAHELLGRHLAHATGEHVFESEIGVDRPPYLADHRVRGSAVFPAAAYAELALAGAAAALGDGSHGLEGVSLLRPMPVDTARVVQLSLTPEAPGTASFQIFSRSAESREGPWELHATGRVRRGARPTAVQRAPAAAPDADGEDVEHYRAMSRCGLDYGPAFRLLRAVRVDGETASAQLPAVGGGRYLLHPTVLDGCLQVLVAALAADAGEAAYLPSSLAGLDVFRAPAQGERLVVRAEVTDRERRIGDVVLVDGDDEPIASVRGLELARIEPDPSARVERLLHEVAWVEASPAELVQRDAGAWLVLADDGDRGAALAAALEAHGERCQLLPWSRRAELPRVLAEAASAQPSLRGIVHLWGLDAAADELLEAEERGSLATVGLLSALDEAQLPTPPRLVLVTRGSRPAGPEPLPLAVAQAPLWGLGAVIANERPELACLRVDLDPREGGAGADLLAAELLAASAEDEIALRGGRRYAARLVPLLGGRRERRTAPAEPGQAYRLEIDEPGVLDELVLRVAERRPPGAGEVEIEVEAAGLNFIDVMKAMGIYPGLDPSARVALGAECAGRVVAVGEAVEGLTPGDRVVAIAPSLTQTGVLASHVVVRAELTAAIPDGLSPEQAATLPIAFVTCQLALIEAARLRRGEKVLVHSATGGVGLAALQIARRAGAEVIATAGTEAKRAYLAQLGVEHVMDSRSLDFASEVLEVTGGRGVDVVLNSLSGEGLRRSLAVLAPYGRFLELGKRDIHDGSALRLDAFKRSLSFTAIDLARDVDERPGLVARLLREVVKDVGDGVFEPLPAEVLPIGEVVEGFRRMARAEHVGKVVFAVAGERPLLEAPAVPVRGDGSYLVIGGLGALGLETARWLVEHGARRVVLASRGAPSDRARGAIAALQATGADIRVVSSDVTEPRSLAVALEEARAIGPLRGVVHAAGLLDDALLERQTPERFRRVGAPKIGGAWSLHEQTRDDPLDLFLLYGSVAPLLGIPGQANYAAANAFLDALAHRRRAEGLPALAVDWAPWAGAGLAAADDVRGGRLVSRGLGSIDSAEGVAALTRLIRDDAIQAAVVPLDVARWGEFNPHGARSPFFAELRAHVGPDGAGVGPGRLRDDLLAVDAGRTRRALLEARLRDDVARVLRLRPDRVPVAKAFKALGMDSLMALELRNRIEAGSGLVIPATALFNYPTVETLAGYVAAQLGVPLEAGEEPDPAAAPAPGADLGGLGRDELESLLAGELEAAQGILGRDRA
jgi:acyl transferase domain-containing protein/acyl carrier protein